MKIINTAIAFASALTVVSCASVNSPEGGAKDTVPPTLISSNPTNQQLNVNGRTISLQFDEDVQQNNLQKELLITPFTDNKYKIKVNEKVMQLIFDNPFQDSTTYIFNFREGIADITEKNIAKGLRLSFSTGSYIDSSKVAGKVVNLLTQQPEKDAIVALYPAEDTTNIRKSRPYYQTLTDTNGQFKLENIREGNYKIFALLDKNTNSLYDNEAERIGYLKAPISVKPDTQQVTLQTFILDSKKPVSLQRQKLNDRLAITYSEGVEKVKAMNTTTKDSILIKTLPDGKTIELFKSPKFKGGKVLVTASDSVGNATTDTIQVDFGQDYTQRIQGASIKLINKTNAPTTYNSGQKLTIELQTQVSIKGVTPVSIMSDSTSGVKIKYPEQITLDKTATELTFTIPKLNTRQRPYTIVLDSTQIQPLDNKKLSFPAIPLTIGEQQGTGSVKGVVAIPAKSFTVQLLDGKYNVVKESKNGRGFYFKDVPPGIYNIRVLIDENNNGKWDRGTPDFKREPEKVMIYPNQIEIRANWELEDIKIEM